MTKKYIIIISAFVVLDLLAGTYYLYKQSQKSATEVATSTEEILPSASTNPLDNKPDINPADQTNPFKNIKTNPFE